MQTFWADSGYVGKINNEKNFKICFASNENATVNSCKMAQINPNQPKYQIIFHRKNSLKYFITRSLITFDLFVSNRAQSSFLQINFG